MNRSLLFLLVCSSWTVVCRAGSSDHVELEAISDDGWDGSLQRRGFNHSKVHLQENEHFVWGSPIGANRTVYVNMTMGTNDDELILSMERFSSELKSVECSEELMTMTFNSNHTYQEAIGSWDWVNFSENRTFIMIANYPGCGKNSSRSPWLVNNVYYDSKNLRVELNSTKKTWQDVAHTYALDFGHYSPPAPAARNGSLTKRWTFDKSFPLNLNHDLPSSMFSPFSEDNFNLVVTCPNCGTTGQLILAGHVEVMFFGGLKTFTISAAPQGIGAALNLDIDVGGTLPTGGLMQTVNLASLDLGGFSIAGILALGPTFNIDAGFGLSSLTGSATFSTGISASIPDSSTAEVDLTGKTASSVAGWVPQFQTQPLRVDAQVEANLEVFTKLSVAASVLVLGNGFSVSLGLKVPDVNLQAVATMNSNGGVCPGSTETIGVTLDASIGAVLELQGYTEVLGTKNMFLNDPLFDSGAAFKFQPVCLAFGPDAQIETSPSTSISQIPVATIVSTVSVIPQPASEVSLVYATGAGTAISVLATFTTLVIPTAKVAVTPTLPSAYQVAVEPSPTAINATVQYNELRPGRIVTTSAATSDHPIREIGNGSKITSLGPGVVPTATPTPSSSTMFKPSVGSAWNLTRSTSLPCDDTGPRSVRL